MGKLTRRRFLAALGSTGVLAGSYEIESRLSRGGSRSGTTLIGHRGFSGLEEDNSMAGFRRANQLQLDGVEADLRLTSDDKLVLSHDPFIVSDQDLQFISRNSYSDLESDSNLVLFKDFLDWFEDTRMNLYMEFKSADAIRPSISKIKERNLSKRTVLMSLMPSHFQVFPDEFETAFAGSITSRIMFERLEGIDPDYIIPHYLPFINVKRNNLEQKIDGYWLLSEKQEDVTQVLNSNPEILISNRPDIVRDIIDER